MSAGTGLRSQGEGRRPIQFLGNKPAREAFVPASPCKTSALRSGVFVVMVPRTARLPVGTWLAPNSFLPPEQSFGRTDMTDLIRGDGGGFLAGSLVAILAVFGIYALTMAL